MSRYRVGMRRTFYKAVPFPLGVDENGSRWLSTHPGGASRWHVFNPCEVDLPVHTLPTETTYTYMFVLLSVVEDGIHPVCAASPSGDRGGTFVSKGWLVTGILPRALAFGKYGEQVIRIIEQTRHITGDQGFSLQAAAGPKPEFNNAALAGMGNAADTVSETIFDIESSLNIRDGGTARAAALATLLRDRITDRRYRELTGPWFHIMGKDA